MTMLHPEVQRASTESVFKKVGVTPYVSRPLPPNDEGRGVPLPENVSDLSLPVRLFQRVSSGAQSLLVVALAMGIGGRPIMSRFAPNTDVLVGQMSAEYYELTDRLNQTNAVGVEDLSEKDLDMIADAALLIYGRIGGPTYLHSIDYNQVLGSKMIAFDAAYRAGVADKAISLYRKKYYEDTPDVEEGLDDYSVIIRDLKSCRGRRLSPRDCVIEIRRKIFNDRKNIPGMENMLEEDIMPEGLRSYLSEEPLSGSLSGNAVADNMVWNKRRRLEIKREHARRLERFGRDQKSANTNRVARRLR